MATVTGCSDELFSQIDLDSQNERTAFSPLVYDSRAQGRVVGPAEEAATRPILESRQHHQQHRNRTFFGPDAACDLSEDRPTATAVDRSVVSHGLDDQLNQDGRMPSLRRWAVTRSRKRHPICLSICRYEVSEDQVDLTLYHIMECPCHKMHR